MRELNNLTNILAHIDQAIYITNFEKRVLFFNGKAENLTGFNSDEVHGLICVGELLDHVDEKGTKICSRLDSIDYKNDESSILIANTFIRHKKGHRIPINLTSIPYINNGEIKGYVEILKDIKKRNQFLDKDIPVKYLSMIDPLTKLYNRNFLDLKIRKGLLKEEKYAIYFIDLNDFKQINDNHGHLVGDEVLKVVAQTLIYNTTNDDYIIRFGGDEFLLFAKVDDIDSAKHLAEKIRVLINNSYIKQIDYYPRVSIGFSLIEDNSNIDKSINNADKDMYVDKNLEQQIQI